MFIGSGLKTILLIISGYFYALILGPSIYGIWQTVRVFIGYGAFINLGMPFILQRDYASLKYQGKEAEAEKLGIGYQTLMQLKLREAIGNPLEKRIEALEKKLKRV